MNTSHTEISEIIELNNRIQDLESRSAFQEDAVNQLNSVIIEQQQMIDQLNLLVEAMRGAIQSANPESIGNTKVEDDIPPHY